MFSYRGRIGLMAVLVVGLLASTASAQLTTEKSASVLVFPKVIANGTRDTIIQITNTSNSMVHAHCFYVNAAPTNPDLPPDPVDNPPLWQEIDFDIWLTKQQPTYWVVSEGRAVDPNDPVCDRTRATDPFVCPNAGIDPGRVPPVVADFVGELKCVEVDASGAPISGNHLKGEATVITQNLCGPQRKCSGDGSRCWNDGDCSVGQECLVAEDFWCELNEETCTTNADCGETTDFNDLAKYNAIGVLGNENNDGSPVLCMGGEPNDLCPNGPEYDACPDTWILNHYAEGAENPLLGQFSEGSYVSTSVTIVPCTQNFETQDPENITLQLLTWNEFEQRFSSSTNVTCWADLKLTHINPLFHRDILFSDFAQTRVRPSSQTNSGLMMVSTETHYIGNLGGGATTNTFAPAAGRPYAPYATASANAHIEGSRVAQDLITIPAEQTFQ